MCTTTVVGSKIQYILFDWVLFFEKTSGFILQIVVHKIQ